MSRWRTGLARADRRDLPLVIGLAALLFIDGALSGEGDVTALAVGAVALATVPCCGVGARRESCCSRWWPGIQGGSP